MPDRSGQPVRRVIILGSTGSIGTQTLEVLEHLNRLAAGEEELPRYEVVGLAAHRAGEKACAQARAWGVQALAVTCEEAPLSACGARVIRGADAPERLVREVECDVVVAAIVGAAGVPATLLAAELGRDIALANKESLVAAGELVIPAARRSGARLLPVDSEHSALWQALQGLAGCPHPCPPMEAPASVRRLILTASGGALRHLSLDEMRRATPAMALKHPTWSMGAKVTIDSASLTNKAFELIEAHWLFGMPSARLDVLVHPQSVVHSLVEFADASVMAQLGSPDMRGPIQFALTFPSRPVASAKALDLAALARLDFTPPDPARYPALALARRVMDEGGTLGATFNAASEAAVEAFLASGESGVVPFGLMGEVVMEACAALRPSRVRDLGDVMEADRAARAWTRERLALGRVSAGAGLGREVSTSGARARGAPA